MCYVTYIHNTGYAIVEAYLDIWWYVLAHYVLSTMLVHILYIQCMPLDMY